MSRLAHLPVLVAFAVLSLLPVLPVGAATLVLADATDGHRLTPFLVEPGGRVRWYRVAPRVEGEGEWYYVVSQRCTDAVLYARESGRSVAHPFDWSTPFARHPTPGLAPGYRVSSAASAAPGVIRTACPREADDVALVSRRSLDETTLTNAVHDLLLAAALSVLVALGVVFFVLTAEVAYLLYAGTLLSAALRSAIDFLPRWLPHLALPPWRDVALSVDAMQVAGIWLFTRTFLRTYRLSRPLDRLGIAAATAVVGVHIAWLVGASLPIFTPLDAGGLIVLYAYGLAASIVALRRGAYEGRYLIIPFSLLVAAIVIDVAGGVSPPLLAAANFALEYTPVIGGVFFFAAIADRMRRTARELVREQQRRITEVERRSVAFARFVPRAFLTYLGRDDVVDVALGDHVEQPMAVLFSDIRRFTTISAALSPADVFAFINAYLARTGPVVRAHGGFVDKYIGDAIMALFPDGPDRAVDAAIALQLEVRRFNDERGRDGLEPIVAGVGIQYGPLMLGTIGESERYDTTVVASAVNAASRLESLTKEYGAPILIGGATYEALREPQRFHIRPLGAALLRGMRVPERVYEVFDADPPHVFEHKRATGDAFAEVVRLYEAGLYAQAARTCAPIATACPDDAPAAVFLRRSDERVETGKKTEASSVT